MLVDHDPARRSRLAAMLHSAPDVQLVGSVSTPAMLRPLLDTLGHARPDVVLAALDLPEGDGLGNTATIRAVYPTRGY
jgi:DNA-binding NarL/FixJ family response regulator